MYFGFFSNTYKNGLTCGIYTGLIVAQTIYARRKIVEDRLFELDGKKASNIMTVFENAEYQRLVRELHDLETVKAADILAKLDKTIESLKK